MSGTSTLGTVVVLGYGNQGETHARNLRDAGEHVRVAARPGRAAEARARAHGFEVAAPSDALAGAHTLAVLLPDEAVPQAWPELAAAAGELRAVVFAHGFNLLYGALDFAPSTSVVLVSPTGPGRVLRELYERGEGLPAYLAVHQAGAQDAWALATHYATSLGCARAQLLRTSVREETEIDLFGEQSVLCGGMNALVTAAYGTLVEAGYTPEVAYLECVHQLKYLADLLHARGVAGLRRGISGTALYGDLTRGPRVINEGSRAEMRAMLAEIRSGDFAREWLAEVAAGKPRLQRLLATADADPIEAGRLRAVPDTPGGPSRGVARGAAQGPGESK
ncbi:MAG: ketol-acid reductoisomerase [Candidatus Eisenbacteria bacterium]